MTGKPVPPISEHSAPYWAAVRSGAFVTQRCTVCDARFLHQRQYCPNCGSPDIDWAPASGRGTVHACTVVHHPPYPAYADDVPYVLAIVRLDEGAQLMTNIVDCDPMQVHVGQPVTLATERRGDVTLPQFRPNPPIGE